MAKNLNMAHNLEETQDVNMARGQALPYPCHPIHGKRVLGCTSEIDYRTRVGTDAWYRNEPPRVNKLHALRCAHTLRSHRWVKTEMEKRGYERAVDVPPEEWADIVATFEERDEKKR